MSTPSTSPVRDFLPRSSAALSSVTADAGRPCAEVVGEDTRAQGQTAAMLRLAEIFPVTVATDLALAGYDVLGWLSFSAAGVPALCSFLAKRVHDGSPLPLPETSAAPAADRRVA